MAKLYATIGSLAGVLAANIFFKIFNIFPKNHFVVFDIITACLIVVGIVSLLRDLNIWKELDKKPLLVIGLSSLFMGYIFELITFGALFYADKFLEVTKIWWTIAPIIILFIGLPILLISKQVAKEKVIWRLPANGWRGLAFNILFCGIYTFVALYIINLISPTLFII